MRKMHSKLKALLASLFAEEGNLFTQSGARECEPLVHTRDYLARPGLPSAVITVSGSTFGQNFLSDRHARRKARGFNTKEVH